MQAEQFLQMFDAGTIVERDFGDLPNAYYVRTKFTEGFSVLDSANTLAGSADVEFAEPNFEIEVGSS